MSQVRYWRRNVYVIVKVKCQKTGSEDQWSQTGQYLFNSFVFPDFGTKLFPSLLLAEAAYAVCSAVQCLYQQQRDWLLFLVFWWFSQLANWGVERLLSYLWWRLSGAQCAVCFQWCLGTPRGGGCHLCCLRWRSSFSADLQHAEMCWVPCDWMECGEQTVELYLNPGKRLYK